MRNTRLAVLFALVSTSGPLAQNPPAPAAITPRLDTPQARVIVATLQPRTPSIARNGHATHPVLIYLDDGVMTRTEGDQSTRIEFRRGDVRWRPASGAYIAENVSDHPIRILELDPQGPPAARAAERPARGAGAGAQAGSGGGGRQALQGRVRERAGARSPHPLRGAREGP